MLGIYCCCTVFVSLLRLLFFFFFNDTATTEIYTLSLHDALPISPPWCPRASVPLSRPGTGGRDRKSTRLNSSHPSISYAVFCLKKKKEPHALGRQAADRGRDHGGVRRQPTRRARGAVEAAGRRHGADAARCFFFNDPATTEIYTLSLHDALPI